MPDAKLDALREKVDIVELVRRYAKLRPVGTNFKGCCPLHHVPERTPSLVVSPVRGVFHCFRCSRGGDVFAFVMAAEQVNLKEATRRLSKWPVYEFGEPLGKAKTSFGSRTSLFTN